MTYRERRSRLEGGVVWTNTATGGGYRVLPDGCMDLIWVDGALLVAGPDTTAHLSAIAGTFAGLRFAPGTAPAVLGVPAHELRDQRVPLEALWSSKDARRAADQVTRDSDRGRGLEALATERLHDATPPSPAMTAVARALQAGASVRSVADSLDLTPRQLHRRSLPAFGYGPKTLARVLRMHRALDLARAGIPFAETAYRSGYADQSHLARDVKSLAGVPLTALTY